MHDASMKILRFAPLILGLTAPVKAEETCMFLSQYQPDVTIEVGTKLVSGTNGKMKYKGSPIFNFSTGIQNGYGGQYFSISSISKPSTKKEEKIVSGNVVTIVGDQVGKKGTPENRRKRGQQKLFFPNFGLNYYYSLAGDGTKPDGRFEGRTKKITTILRAAEGFWIPSEICKKYVFYGWN